MSQSYFDIFDLPPRYALDPQDLERRYRALSQKWHPDRHGRAPAAERVAVLQRATDLNEAYRVLRDPRRRAEYLLRCRGIDVGAEAPDKQVAVDPAFLMEIMELRESLAEAQAAKDDARVQAMGAEVRGRMAADEEAIAAGFARLEGGDQGALPELTQKLVATRYYQRFCDEIEVYEENGP